MKTGLLSVPVRRVLAATIYGEAMYSMVPMTSMTAQSQASWAWVMTHDASVAAM